MGESTATTDPKAKVYDPKQQEALKGCPLIYTQLVPTHPSDIPIKFGNYVILPTSRRTLKYPVKSKASYFKIDGIYWNGTMFMIVARWCPRAVDLGEKELDAYKKAFDGREWNEKELFYTNHVIKRPAREVFCTVHVGKNPMEDKPLLGCDCFCDKLYDPGNNKFLKQFPEDKIEKIAWLPQSFSVLQIEVENLRKGQWRKKALLAGVPLTTDEKLEEEPERVDIVDDIEVVGDIQPLEIEEEEEAEEQPPPLVKRKIEEVLTPAQSDEETVRKGFFGVMDTLDKVHLIIEKFVHKGHRRAWMDSAIKGQVERLLELVK